MKIICLIIAYISLGLNSLTASPVSFLSEIKNTSLHKSMYLGDIDFIKFEQPVTLIHYLNKEKEAEKLRGFIASADKKLQNEGFMAKAPADVVDGIRATKAEQEAQLESIERIIRELS